MIVIPTTSTAATKYTAATTFTKIAPHDYGIVQFGQMSTFFFQMFAYQSGYDIEPAAEVFVPTFGSPPLNWHFRASATGTPLAGIRLRSATGGNLLFRGAFFQASEVAYAHSLGRGWFPGRGDRIDPQQMAGARMLLDNLTRSEAP